MVNKWQSHTQGHPQPFMVRRILCSEPDNENPNPSEWISTRGVTKILEL